MKEDSCNDSKEPVTLATPQSLSSSASLLVPLTTFWTSHAYPYSWLPWTLAFPYSQWNHFSLTYPQALISASCNPSSFKVSPTCSLLLSRTFPLQAWDLFVQPFLSCCLASSANWEWACYSLQYAFHSKNSASRWWSLPAQSSSFRSNSGLRLSPS